MLRRPGGSQQPQQLPQHLRQLKHVQQHDRPQKAQRMTHQRMLNMMRPPTMMMAMTGHLRESSGQQRHGQRWKTGKAYLQNEASMQLSQLEKAVLTSVMVPCASPTTFRLDRPRATATFKASQAPGLSDLAMATSIEGISPSPAERIALETTA